MFYVPGVQPRTYHNLERVTLQVERLSSPVTQLPYSYYDLPFCGPKEHKMEPENLGEILRGDRIENSLYEIKALENVDCRVLCQANHTAEDLQLFQEKILQKYQVHWIVDNLPAMIVFPDPSANPTAPPKYREEGFALGVAGADVPGIPDSQSSISAQAFLNNHVDITLYYNKKDDGVMIVGFAVDPDSVQHSTVFKEGVPISCSSKETYERQSVSGGKPITITYTYAVKWVETSLSWHNRWEPIFSVQSGKVHWFSILNSIIIVLFLTSMVAVIMTNILKSDFKRYSEMSVLAVTTATLLSTDVEKAENNKESKDAPTKPGKQQQTTSTQHNEDREETGWKLVHGDVFRPPPFSMLFSLLVGFGSQVTACTLITMVFSVLGFLSPANRGSLLTAMIISFTLTGVISGYFSGRLYKFFAGKNWKHNALMTALLVQGILFLIFFILDCMIATQKSSGHIPPKVLVILISIWIGVSTPLVFVGSYIAMKTSVIEIPTRVNLLPREIPNQPWYNKAFVCVLLGGVLPFAAIFIELYFILSSIWLDQIYYLFGFLSLVFLVLVIACSEVSIVLTYIQLCGEDWKWWWRSFFSVGASALYLFLYAIFYCFSKLHINQPISLLIYFGYTTIITVVFFAFTGSIGFVASFWFVKKIYASIKID